MTRLLSRWPGLDGWLLIVLSTALVSTYLIRGGLGGGKRMLIILAINAVWLAVRWWISRESSKETAE